MVDVCKAKHLGTRKYRCFFELTLQLIGGKWKPIILYQLAIEGVMRFGELKRAIPDVTERMLTRQLREMEADGLIHREVYHQVPPKVEYSLRPIGARLIPVLLEMRNWGMEYESHTNSFLRDTLPEQGFESNTPPQIAERYLEELKP
jgi:DNA-binding HxlR family transcriptional regulator